MKKRWDKFGGALAATTIAAGVPSCAAQHDVAATSPEISRPSLEEVHENSTPITEGRDCAVWMARRVLFNLPHLDGRVDKPTQVYARDPASASGILEPNGSSYTFTYGAYMASGGQFVNPQSREAEYFAKGQVRVQLNEGETPLQALRNSDQGTLGVVESQQQIQSGPKEPLITPETNPGSADVPGSYCDISSRIFSR